MKARVAAMLLFCSAGVMSVAHAESSFWSEGIGISTCGDFVAAMRQSIPDMMTVEPTGRFFSESTVYVEW